MLELRIEPREFFNENTGEFIAIRKETILKLEHSLLSISKWEARWHKRFLDKSPKTQEENLDYIRCMSLNRDVPNEVYDCLMPHHIEQINEYISDPMTATTFRNTPNRGRSGEAISSELVYYWMTAFNIPFECEKWHFNRLMTLINICSTKSQPAKKMSKKSVMRQNASINEARRKAMNTKG